MLKVLAGSCSVLGVASVSTRSLPCKGQSQGTGGDPWPEPGLGHLHVESRVVTARTKPHHSGRIPGGSLGLGWCGVERAGGRCRWGFLSPACGVCGSCTGAQSSLLGYSKPVPAHFWLEVVGGEMIPSSAFIPHLMLHFTIQLGHILV